MGGVPGGTTSSALALQEYQMFGSVLGVDCRLEEMMIVFLEVKLMMALPSRVHGITIRGMMQYIIHTTANSGAEYTLRKFPLHEADTCSKFSLGIASHVSVQRRHGTKQYNIWIIIIYAHAHKWIPVWERDHANDHGTVY